jgi:hypothetical protein
MIDRTGLTAICEKLLCGVVINFFMAILGDKALGEVFSVNRLKLS